VTSPRVSVLLPVCNAAATVARAVASVQVQTMAAWELVMVENGSTDETPAILAGLAADDPRIHILNMPEPDLVAALNRGLGCCRGEFVARLDADDEMHPARLADQVAAMVEHPDWGVVGCRVAFGGDVTTQAGYAEHVTWLNAQITPDEIWRSRFVESPLAHPSVMWRRSVSAAHGGYRAGDFPEDYELWLRWLEAGVRMGKIEAERLVWHDAPDRLSRTDDRYRTDAFFRTKAVYVARELSRSGRGRAVWVAGAGRPTRQRAAELERHGVTISGYWDIDPRKIGQTVAGRPVVGTADLPHRDEIVVLSYVGNRGARAKVRSRLGGQGRQEGKDFWLCA